MEIARAQVERVLRGMAEQISVEVSVVGVWRRVLQLENGLAIPKVIALEIQTLVLRRIESYSCL